ncbi:MAG: glycosyltransferase family 4 protein, partial [Bacillota bacterium]|nr:glycosyltransferase family 4 protein [Bacillota bacterium]
MDIRQNKKLLYVGYYVDDETFETAIRAGNHDLSRARQNFEKRLLSAFSENLSKDEWSIVSYFPSNGGVSQFESFVNHKAIDVFSFSQTIADCLKAYKAFRQYLINRNEKSFEVVLYSLQPIMTLACLSLKRRLNIRITTICSELPQYRAAGNKVPIKRRIKNILQKYLNRCVDQYILFSNAMRDEIPVGNKRAIVVEGIAPEINLSEKQPQKENIVMYAGGLGKQNNIRMLIDACKKSKLVEQLWICGDGDELDYVKQHTNEKVRYLGNLTNDEVLRLEKYAKVLVNIRDPQIMVTKYAFPSKILEYLSVGTAVVSTVLEGIPNEYYEFIKAVTDVSVDGVSQCIDEILELPENEYNELCNNGEKWISENKTADAQAKRILKFVFS